MKIVFQQYTPITEPENLLFVEIEDDHGNSINAGEWGDHKEPPYKTLTISVRAHIDALSQALLEIDERNALEQLLASQQTPRQWQRLTPDELSILEQYRQGDGNLMLVERLGDPE